MIRLLEKLKNILEAKRNLPSLQPIECAYLYKTYSNLGKACIQLGDYEKGRDCLKEAEIIFGNKENEDLKRGFYPWMFGKEPVVSEGKMMARWKLYKSAAQEKLRIRDVYIDISNTAIGRKVDDEYFEYSFKILELDAQKFNNNFLSQIARH